MKDLLEIRHAHSPDEVKQMSTSQLREHFLISKIFKADKIQLTLSYYDRFISGGVMPVNEKLSLPNPENLKANFFLQRRELGIINVGENGKIIADGAMYHLANKEALYIGKETKEVQFVSDDPTKPAKFYINSSPAHRLYETKKIPRDETERVQVGSSETANLRVINKYIVNSIVPTCQLQMGMTELKQGSVWNTMPAHVHDRRMEVYFYFDIKEEHSVCHFMGEPEETRHIWMQNEQAVISPNWSIHAGVGTSGYSFIWGMAGENLDYADMDVFPIHFLK